MPKGCFKCDGSGKICNICGESEPACGCSEDEIEEYLDENPLEEQYDDCEDCKGTGE